MTAENQKSILAIGAHPDDVEFICAGTLALLKARGWRIFTATLTAGDLGSAHMTREQTAKTRAEEARKAAQLLDAPYRCLDIPDLGVTFDDETVRRVTACVREADPAIVITHPHNDYHPDHIATAQLVHKACFAASIPNYETPVAFGSAAATKTIPHLYYADPVGGVDFFRQPAKATHIVNISTTIETKAAMLACHASQRDWLKQQHGMDHYVEQMRAWSRTRAASINAAYAEGFTQHLGIPFPQDDALADALGNFVHRRFG